jgi:putative ABC transport system permease protein
MADLRDAWRAMRATPVVSTIAVLSLALGIGANTAIFSLINALMLRNLPVREPQDLVQLLDGTQRSAWTNPLWESLRARDRQLFDGAFAYWPQRLDAGRGGEVQPVNAMVASGEAFDVLGVPAILGRTFSPADDVPGGGKDGPVAVISFGYWQRRFGGAASAIGAHLSLERAEFTVIGVLPPEFTGIDEGRRIDVAVPLSAEPLIRGEKQSLLKVRSAWWLSVVARLKPGQTMDGAIAALRNAQPQLRAATIPENYKPQQVANYLKEPFNARSAANGPNPLGLGFRQPLFVLMGLVALVLLIACANIANLLLARTNARRHELSVRAALGASAFRLGRQLLVESLLLACAGAALGLVFARWAAQLIVVALSTTNAALTIDVGADWRVLSFTAIVAGATALIFGTVPALLGTRAQPNDALKETGRGTAGEARFGFGSALVVAQVALSLVLVVGAGLFVHTFASLAHLRLGFDPDPVLLVQVNTKQSVAQPAGRLALYDRVLDAVAGVPGVQRAAYHWMTPVSYAQWDLLLLNPPGLSLPDRERDVYLNAIGPGWISAYGMSLVAGRDFDAHDDVAAPRVAIANETFVKKYLSGTGIGRTIQFEPGSTTAASTLQIVGVTRDAVYSSLREPIPPTVYVPIRQIDPGRVPVSLTMVVRSATGSPALLSRPIAEAIGRVDGSLALTFHPMRDYLRDAVTEERVLAMLSGFFGGLALLLAGLGLYGVMSYAVSRRRMEIGIRMALGAGPSGAVRLILLRAATLVGLGVACGAAVALWASRFVSTLLFGLQPRDPVTLLAAAAVLLMIGGLAGWLPARRAAHIDPAQVLREG